MDEEFLLLVVKDPRMVIGKGRPRGQGLFVLPGPTVLPSIAPVTISSVKPKKLSIKPNLVK